MPKFDDYTQKTTPEDTDIALILDKTANVNKKTPFSGIWTWIVNKMTNAVIQNLQTTNKTVIGSINELNRNKVIAKYSSDLFSESANGVFVYFNASSKNTPYTADLTESTEGIALITGNYDTFFSIFAIAKSEPNPIFIYSKAGETIYGWKNVT